MDSDIFVERFIGHFIGAGLCEELFKSIPIWVFLFFSSRLSDHKINGFENSKMTPAAGILIGVASALGFILIETIFQYVPNVIEYTGETSAGFMLLIPRFITGISGHTAWSGMVGYFIGLSQIYKKKAILLIFGGWVFASLLHGLWNSVDNTIMSTSIAIISFILFVGYIHKINFNKNKGINE